MSPLALLGTVAALLLGLPSLSLERPRQSTPLALDASPRLVGAAHKAVFGKWPGKHRLAMAVAHLRIEGSLRSLNFNLGSVMAGKGEPYVRASGLRLRAYRSHAEAARAYWALLRRRCPRALHAFDARDPESAAELLARCHYHETPVATYARGLRGCL